MRNPFAKKHDPDRPAPGGIDGGPVDYVRWYPPDTPFRWGQGFPTPFTNVPAINGGRWPQERRFTIPDHHWEMPWGVEEIAYRWPGIVGTSGAWERQLVGSGAPQHSAGAPVATAMDAYAQAQAQRPADISVFAGSFARS